MRIDAVRAETEVEKIRQDLLAAHLSLDNARDALATLMASSQLPLPAALPTLPSPLADGGAIPPEMLGRRPDVQAARATARVADRLVTASWMQFLPTLGVAGQYGYLFTDPPDLGSDDRSRWTALVTLSVPLYSQLRYADLEQKRAQHAQARVREADLLANAELEVRKAHRDFLSALSTVETAERQAALTREALSLTEIAYENGAVTSLEVTDAQRNHRMAELNTVAQKLRSQLALLGLLRATGESATALASAR